MNNWELRVIVDEQSNEQELVEPRTTADRARGLISSVGVCGEFSPTVPRPNVGERVEDLARQEP